MKKLLFVLLIASIAVVSNAAGLDSFVDLSSASGNIAYTILDATPISEPVHYVSAASTVSNELINIFNILVDIFLSGVNSVTSGSL